MSEIQHISEALRTWIDGYIEAKVAEEIHDRLTQDRIMTKTDIAARYGVLAKTVHNWKYEGKIPCRQPSNEVFLSDLEAMEAAGVVPGKRGSKKWVSRWRADNISITTKL